MPCGDVDFKLKVFFLNLFIFQGRCVCACIKEVAFNFFSSNLVSTQGLDLPDMPWLIQAPRLHPVSSACYYNRALTSHKRRAPLAKGFNGPRGGECTTQSVIPNQQALYLLTPPPPPESPQPHPPILLPYLHLSISLSLKSQPSAPL